MSSYILQMYFSLPPDITIKNTARKVLKPVIVFTWAMYSRPKFEYSTLSVGRIRILMTSFPVKMIVLSVSSWL